MGRRPTLDDLARHAGVSRTVASRAVNGEPNVSPVKRAAVARAVAELGFVPNATARALATNRAGAVVLAVSGDDPALVADPFYVEVIVGVAAVLEEADLDLTLLLAASDRGRARLERALQSRRTDGLMLMATRGDDPLLAIARATDSPVVLGGRPLHGDAGLWVDVDNEDGGRRAAEHLLATGRRRVGIITGGEQLRAPVDRRRGAEAALRAAGADVWVEDGDFSADSGERATERLLERHPDLDGVVAGSDNMAAGALRTLRARGRSVPDDVAVVGYDDLPVAQQTDPPLTTVRQPIRRFGAELAAALVQAIEGRTVEPVLLPTTLVVRGSAPAS